MANADAHSARSKGVPRRKIVQGVAWSAPALAVATTAPAIAASGPCETATVRLQPGLGSSDSIALSAMAPSGDDYTLTISTVLGANTIVSQGGQGFNLSTTGSGWSGLYESDGSDDYVFEGFAPAGAEGAVVLNQRGSSNSGAYPSQTLTFTFRHNGIEFDPTSFSLDIFDITSGELRENWRTTYWDAVGFSVAPTSISKVSGPYTGGTGSGTVAAPYRRAGGSQPTMTGYTVLDRFTFDSFPSGTTMRYSNYNRRGWHFISLAGMQFEVGDCG